MGLFDTLIPPEGTVCPICSAPTTDFQTKALDNLLRTYSIGDDLMYDEPMSIDRGWVSCYTSCDSCKAWIDARAFVERNRYVGLEISEATPKSATVPQDDS